MTRVVVIGAGIWGLAAAAGLSRSGLDVTVLESQVVPGGCASTFYHQGYRFDAGATLAGGFYPGGPMDRLAGWAGIDGWAAHPADVAMVVHLPDGSEVARYPGEQRWAEYRAAFGKGSLTFWEWQERTADALWALALRLPAWPPGSLDEAFQLAAAGSGWLADQPLEVARLVAYTGRTVSDHLDGLPIRLRQFVDAQLLISAQVTSERANALYGASALDLPRRGVVHLQGGMGSIAARLVEAIEANGGRVLFRQRASRICIEKGHPVAVNTRSDSFPADVVIANLTPWNVAELLGEAAPARLRTLPRPESSGWGAFVLYLGVEDAVVPVQFPLHHQVIKSGTLAEGNSVFLSFSPDWDSERAPRGQRAVTLSTHTRLDDWWELNQSDRKGYDARKKTYTARLLDAAERILPGIGEGTDFSMAGTPVTFERFTGRRLGWVGGFPQTSLLKSISPKVGKSVWMVGDSVFPGQSVAAAALGGMRVADSILRELHMPEPRAIVKDGQLCPLKRTDEAQV